MPIERKARRVSLLAAFIVATTSACGSSLVEEPTDSLVEEPTGPGVIVFSAQPSTEDFIPQLFVMEEDGTGLRQLTDDQLHRTAMAWSPDGSRIAYAAMEFAPDWKPDEENFTSIFSIALDGSGERRLCSECS